MAPGKHPRWPLPCAHHHSCTGVPRKHKAKLLLIIITVIPSIRPLAGGGVVGSKAKRGHIWPPFLSLHNNNSGFAGTGVTQCMGKTEKGVRMGPQDLL